MNYINLFHLFFSNYNLWNCFSKIINSILSYFQVIFLYHINILRVILIYFNLWLDWWSERALRLVELPECFYCLVEWVFCLYIFLWCELKNYVPCLLIFRKSLNEISNSYSINNSLPRIACCTTSMGSLI